ncbi:uncharacterized protein BXZ73DRAFT_78152 [Epithele typhae]|uniref:uncharacterized protein n=1 Tax=Epithele typhae TaxID=378194 RepID=UPI002008A9AA|nr:uncharacterized protein BXZ73DRAFT_78152 [Epithele typhae]KAH9929616.1 hypothetical protein BXZ73DRAFT_78152 [Epithele typhae]
MGVYLVDIDTLWFSLFVCVFLVNTIRGVAHEIRGCQPCQAPPAILRGLPEMSLSPDPAEDENTSTWDASSLNSNGQPYDHDEDYVSDENASDSGYEYAVSYPEEGDVSDHEEESVPHKPAALDVADDYARTAWEYYRRVSSSFVNAAKTIVPSLRIPRPPSRPPMLHKLTEVYEPDSEPSDGCSSTSSLYTGDPHALQRSDTSVTITPARMARWRKTRTAPSTVLSPSDRKARHQPISIPKLRTKTVANLRRAMTPHLSFESVRRAGKACTSIAGLSPRGSPGARSSA